MTVLSVTFQTLNHWFLSKGKLKKVYPLTIAVNICCILLEGFLALRDPTQISILLFIPLYVFAIIMAIKGLKRENKEKTQEKSDAQVV